MIWISALDLREALTEIFERCDEKGLERPWTVCAASPNGSAVVLRIHGEGTPDQVLAEHIEPEGFLLPMSVVAIDRHNEAALVKLDVSGDKVWH